MNGEQLLPISLCHLMNETSQCTRNDVMGTREISERRHMQSSECNVQASSAISSAARFNFNYYFLEIVNWPRTHDTLTWISTNRCSSKSSSSSFISLSSNFHTLLHTSHDSASILSTFCFFDALPPEMFRVKGVVSFAMDVLLNSLGVNDSLLLLSFDWFRLLVMLFDLK